MAAFEFTKIGVVLLGEPRKRGGDVVAMGAYSALFPDLRVAIEEGREVTKLVASEEGRGVADSENRVPHIACDDSLDGFAGAELGGARDGVGVCVGVGDRTFALPGGRGGSWSGTVSFARRRILDDGLAGGGGLVGLETAWTRLDCGLSTRLGLALSIRLGFAFDGFGVVGGLPKNTAEIEVGLDSIQRSSGHLRLDVERVNVHGDGAERRREALKKAVLFVR
jgi:hypothetical protein